ncbi:MAG: MFS transporter [Oscillospiraceae bacterium]|nr:MFS transporter [Oscillospiraceae bacterium]
MRPRRRSWRQIAASVRQTELFDAQGLDGDTRRSLYWVIWAVMVGQVCGFITTGVVWTGYLRDVIRADDFALGLITAAPVAANTMQLLGAYLMQRWQKRRAFLLAGGLVARFFWLPIALLPYLVPSLYHDARMLLVSICVVAVAVGNSFVNVAWSSLMADIVPMRIRGNYFAARAGASMVIGLAGVLLASLLVDRMGQQGYTAALVLAGVTGMLDIACFFKVGFPPLEGPAGGVRPGFGKVLREVFADKHFMRVVYCFTCWSFAMNISAPFYNVHMLDNLRMGYTEITLLNQVTTNVATLLFVSRWGRPLDRFGGKAVVQLVSRVCMLSPLLWLFITRDTLWLMFIANALTGIFLPVIDLGQQNLYLEAAPKQNRAMSVAVFFAMTNLLGVALSNTLGGYLLQTVYGAWAAGGAAAALGLNKYHFIFATSSALRMLVVFALFPLMREEGGTHYRKAAATMLLEKRQGWGRFYHAVRASRLRLRYRAKLREEQADLDTAAGEPGSKDEQ